MKTYKVLCGMRPAGSLSAHTSSSTIFRTVIVQAEDINAARLKAIDECYDQWHNVEHIRPVQAVLVP